MESKGGFFSWLMCQKAALRTIGAVKTLRDVTWHEVVGTTEIGGLEMTVCVSNCPWTPTTHRKMKVLMPRNMGEIAPKNEGNVRSHGGIVS